MQKNRKSENRKAEKIVKIAIASAIGSVLTVGMLFVCAAVALHNDLNGSVLPVFAFGSCAVCAFFTGFIAAKLMRRNGILYGTLSDVLPCILLTILCAAFYGSVAGRLALCCVLMLLMGAVGGICAVNTRRKKRYR